MNNNFRINKQFNN